MVMEPAPSARGLIATMVAAVLVGGCVPRDAATSPVPLPTSDPPAREIEQGRGRCGVTDLGQDYGTRIEPAEGRPGDDLTFSGTTFRGEDGRWAPSRKIELWLSDGRLGVPASDGTVLVVTVVPRLACRFRTTATVPEVPPGRYRLTPLVFSGSGYGYFLHEPFLVLPPRAGEPTGT